MNWWRWMVNRFRRTPPGPSPDEVTEQDLERVQQKIEATVAGKTHAEQAAQVTGEYEAFRPTIEEKERNLHYLEAQRDVLLRHRRQPGAYR